MCRITGKPRHRWQGSEHGLKPLEAATALLVLWTTGLPSAAIDSFDRLRSGLLGQLRRLPYGVALDRDSPTREASPIRLAVDRGEFETIETPSATPSWRRLKPGLRPDTSPRPDCSLYGPN